jgi:hypothetical protein
MSSLTGSLHSLQGQVSGLSGQVGSIGSQASSTASTVSILTNCMSETPITQYGDGLNNTFGYVWDTSGTQTSLSDTTALDATAAGDPVSAWMLYDQCNTTPTASAANTASRATARSGLGTGSPFAPLRLNK